MAQAEQVYNEVLAITNAKIDALQKIKADALQSMKYIIVDTTRMYVVVQLGEGLNGSNISLDLTNPHMFKNIDYAMDVACSIKAENGKGQLSFEIMRADFYANECIKMYQNTLDFLKTQVLSITQQ
jgi:hypothetical protein